MTLFTFVRVAVEVTVFVTVTGSAVTVFVFELPDEISTHASAGQVLIGPHVYAAAAEAVESASVGELELKGFARPIATYEVRRCDGGA